ncbi:Protein of unknown function DUF2349 [Penicillium chermesinum]|uniref:Ima1 N-terminal domain-containing protein n=1 Tax=Penicillium chermesinum TaxID=63820 RepID=A0A9W9NT08_9EURO|nr:Protein of unknown function DUF2349 [Penicillium chermesinum]KAJ5224109.1 Protein of unknown function DUF2349 [Penicillium chermesinum]
MNLQTRNTSVAIQSSAGVWKTDTPQVCDQCEPRVRQRIRQAGYEAKADHLRRMMDQSKASKAARRTRERSWQSLLVYAGAFGYWTSVLGQLVWDIASILTATAPTDDLSMSSDTSMHLWSCAVQTIEIYRIPQECALDMSSSAGTALVVGVLSLWWNPKLRAKINGRSGRFTGLGEYYQIQFIALVVRCVFWALLKDPSASGLEQNLPPALHMVMLAFTAICVLLSRRVVDYDTSPLVNWSDNSWEMAPIRSTRTSPASTSQKQKGPLAPSANSNALRNRFPVDKLAAPRVTVEKPPAIPTPPPENDDMDWTPSRPQDLQPKISVYHRNRSQPSVFDGPNPFQGQIPAAPKPPAWTLRTKTSAKPIEQVVEPNPFHRSPTQSPTSWKRKSDSSEPIFKPPRFFPSSDHNTSTGLETLFDRAFTIETGDEPKRNWRQPKTSQKSPLTYSQAHLIFQSLRLSLLSASVVAWTLSQNQLFFIRGNYIEIGALGSASLIAGFALLEAVKRPLGEWNGMEILIYITELGAAVHFGAHLPQDSFDRHYFDRYGKIFLGFMIIQEALGLYALYQAISKTSERDPTKPTSPQFDSSKQQSPQCDALAWSPSNSPTLASPPLGSFGAQSSAPALSFGSTAGTQSFSSALPATAPQYRLSSSQSLQSLSSGGLDSLRQMPQSLTMKSLKEMEPLSDSEQDSDTETVATTATNATDATTRNIRYTGQANPYSNVYSPRRSDLGPGIGGLSLDDGPSSRRITRSQSQRAFAGQGLSSRLRR